MLPIDLTHLLLSCFLLRSAWPLLVPCAQGRQGIFWVRRRGQRTPNYYDITTPLAYAPQSTPRG